MPIRFDPVTLLAILLDKDAKILALTEKVKQLEGQIGLANRSKIREFPLDKATSPKNGEGNMTMSDVP